MKLLPALVALLCASPLVAAGIGDFESARDVGAVTRPGSASQPEPDRYEVQGSGANIWGKEDAFQFVSKPVTGDVSFTADIAWPAPGKEPHRKAALMLRDGFESDAPYVDVAVHGDGLIELQYRKTKGGVTAGVRTPVQAPATVRIERDGDVFTASVAKGNGAFQPIGAIALPLAATLQTGLAVSAHNPQNLETAAFSHVRLTHRLAKPDEKRVRETSLELLNVETGERRLVFRERSIFEAPNWSRDGRQLYFNRQGRMFTISVDGGEPRALDTGAADKCNNDHGLSFDGKWLAVSSGGGKDGSRVYVLPATGGTPRLVTAEGPSYWHGWSPDGRTLLYTGRRNGNFDIYASSVDGGPEKQLTSATGLDDGSEFTADGTKIYFNSERTGVMQLWRMNPDGSQQEPVTTDPAFADWFPHASPDGKWLVFVSYEGSVSGHPADRNVTLRLMPLGGGKARVIATLFGGQGTMNVPSWSPDSRWIAFVSYRNVLP